MLFGEGILSMAVVSLILCGVEPFSFFFEDLETQDQAKNAIKMIVMNCFILNAKI
jgi:hypothetical protein